MKIVNVENGKKKVYVQNNDLMMMMQLGSVIPAEVMEKVFNRVFMVIDENRFEFVEFVESNTIKFFEGCDWIVDYRHYKNMTEEEIIADGQKMGQKMNEIALNWNSMTEKEREKNESLLIEYKRLDFKMKSTAEILWTKQGYREMPFPIVPDYKGFKVTENEGCPYIAQQGINPLQVLIYRIDGEVLDRKRENFPRGLIQTTETLLINDNLEHNEFFGDNFESTRIISDDGKYLVTTFKIKPPQVVSEKEETLEDTNNKDITKDNDKPKSLAKRFKDWIKKTF